MNALKQLQKARAGLILDHPFYGALAMKTRLIEDTSTNTMYTDGIIFGYNPDFISGLTIPETKGLLAHECLHIMLSHHLRRQNRDPKNWNIAGDMAINGILEKAGFTLPPGGIPGGIDDKSAEQYYAGIPEKQPGDNTDDENGDGDGDKNISAPGEVRDMPGKNGQKMSPAEMKQAESDLKVSIQQAATQAKAAGKIPAGMERLIDEIIEPTVDWKELLNRFIETVAKNDYAWSPPNRRHVHRGLYLPSLHSRELQNLTVIMDTSCSIDPHMLAEMGAEISAAAASFNAEITVIYVDSDVQGVETFQAGDDIELMPKGGGGTDFKPGFDYINDEGLTPTIIVYLTDGECNSFPDTIPCPLLWCIFGDNNRFNPPMGDVISID